MLRRLKCDIYPVGLAADLHQFKRLIWCHPRPGEVIVDLLVAAARGARRRSYWNGFLAETENVGRCGHGWTRKRAYRRLVELSRSRIWITHRVCGTRRLSSTIVRRDYCITCKRDAHKRQWDVVWNVPLPPLRYVQVWPVVG